MADEDLDDFKASCPNIDVFSWTRIQHIPKESDYPYVTYSHKVCALKVIRLRASEDA